MSIEPEAAKRAGARTRAMIARLVIQTTLWLVAMAALLFVPAGRTDWPGAWAFLIEMAVMGFGIGLWLARHDPALLAERLSLPLQRGQKTWDKVFLSAVMALFILWLVAMALDAGSRRWSAVPLWAQILGALLILLTGYLGYLAMRENSYAAAVVKVQRERGQKTVSTAPTVMCATRSTPRPSSISWARRCCWARGAGSRWHRSSSPLSRSAR
jgi:hypothetical protein